MKLLDKLFRREDIGTPNSPYLIRWVLFSLPFFPQKFRIYLHHFVGDDWSRDLHDHPRRFVSIGLWGRYIEEVHGGEREWKAPWIRSFPAEHIHRIRLKGPGQTCWTLVLVFSPTRRWGFWDLSGNWTHWKDYIFKNYTKESNP